MSAIKTAITPTRAEDFPAWYQEVIKAADMAENSPVRGCMIIKPYGYAVWENMQRIFDATIKSLGVQNAYFPLLIPLSFMEREAEHVEGFAKECAVVTHHRLEAFEGGLRPAGKLEEPYIIRPTSETIIGDAMSRWVQSYRDLPLKLNQWCNVFRWEMRTRLFLRTAEFLWQEGHNAFETADESRADALKMLQSYADFAENTLALPVICGEKTADERFPGAIATYTIESMMQDGKALQAGTSHDLGQNFAKSSGIQFQGKDGQQNHAWTTSWGISTRLIGAMILTHGDDDGMIMPPHIAPVQVEIIPISRTDEPVECVLAFSKELADKLRAIGIRADVNTRSMRSADKMWQSIKKGVPIRVEIGERELEEGKLTFVRRDLGKPSKESVTAEEFVGRALGLLMEIHDTLFNRAKAYQTDRTSEVYTLPDLEDLFKNGHEGFVTCPTAILSDKSWEDVAKTYSLTTRCLPFADNGQKVLIARAY